jgi:hypothetical protein
MLPRNGPRIGPFCKKKVAICKAPLPPSYHAWTIDRISPQFLHFCTLDAPPRPLDIHRICQNLARNCLRNCRSRQVQGTDRLTPPLVTPETSN